MGGVPELVRPSLTDLLAKAEDTDDFSEKIVQLLTDKTMRQHMANTCRETALREYSIGLQSKRYLSIYQEILK